MASLGIERAAIIGHDRGARVGLRLAKDHPDVVARFAALDNIPTRVLFGNMNAASAQAAWFFLFRGVRDLPEALIHGREELWLRHLLTGWVYNPETFTDADIATYVRAYAQPGGLRGAFEDYRAWREGRRAGSKGQGRQTSLPHVGSLGERVRGRKDGRHG